MLYEYAILPDVFHVNLLEEHPSAYRDLKRLLRGLSENGLLTDLHDGEWHRFVTEKMLPDLSPTMRSDILTALSNLQDRHRLVTHPKYSEETPTLHADWLDEALEAAQQNNLSGIVLSEALMKKELPHPLFMEIAEALDSPLWINKHQTADIETSVSGLRTALCPILKYAKTIDVIDPYFKCGSEGCRRFVELCVDLLGSQRPTKTTRRISIHTGRPYAHDCPSLQQPYWIEQCRKEWMDYLSDLVRTNPRLRFEVFLWSHGEPSLRFHDRYLLTDQCGISFGIGWEVCAGNTSTMAFLDENVREKQSKRVQPEHSPFKRLAEPLIVPAR